MIKILNWSSYQSYKDRKPPWIRLHRSLIDNYEFQLMSSDSRALLPMLWLLACEHDDPTSGLIDSSIQKISFRLRISTETVTESLLEITEAGFIELNQPCIETVTEPLLKSNPTVPPETETETETETEKKKPLSGKPDAYTEDFLTWWAIYPKKTGKGAAAAKWKKLKVPLSAACESLAWQTVSKSWIDGYIPNPETYLHQRRWEDEPSQEVIQVPRGPLTFNQQKTENTKQAMVDFVTGGDDDGFGQNPVRQIDG